MDKEKARQRVDKLSQEVAHSDDDQLEREIALGDRRAALDGLVQSVSWLIGTALLLNGGALLAVIGQSDLPLEVALFGPFVFLFGLFFAVMAAGLAGHYAVRSIDRANAALKRLPQAQMVRAVRWQLALNYLITFCVAASYLLFGAGAIGALKSTAEARLDAAPTVHATAPEGLPAKP